MRSPFETWQRIKLKILRHEKILWMLHSAWALAYGILIMIFFKGDFGQVRKLLFFLMFLMLLILAFDRVADYESRRGENRRGVKLVLNYVMKNMYQALYFFMLPFYWEATCLTSIQWVFTAALGVLAVLSTQDLFFDNFLMERKWFRNIYFSFCLLASFHLMLPVLLPLPLHITLPLAAFAAAFTFFLLHMPAFVWKEHHLRWVFASCAGAALLLFLARPLLPPVPYRVVRTTITGEAIDASGGVTPAGVYFVPVHELQHRPLHACSLIESPTFPHDLFRHEYRHRGRLVLSARTSRQDLGGGRYRLVSSLDWRDLAILETGGTWSVTLVTAGGVVMDSAEFEVVDTRPREASPEKIAMTAWTSPHFSTISACAAATGAACRERGLSWRTIASNAERKSSSPSRAASWWAVWTCANTAVPTCTAARTANSTIPDFTTSAGTPTPNSSGTARSPTSAIRSNTAMTTPRLSAPTSIWPSRNWKISSKT